MPQNLGSKESVCVQSELISKTGLVDLKGTSLSSGKSVTSDILTTFVNLNASYSWKGICGAHHIISLGSRWQVGEGTLLNI